MLTELEENRSHLMATFTKYTTDENFKNQLSTTSYFTVFLLFNMIPSSVSLLTKYSKECREAEEKLTNLARSTWKEMCKANDEDQKELKGHISELVVKNRELQAEIDRLMKVIESTCTSLDITGNKFVRIFNKSA